MSNQLAMIFHRGAGLFRISICGNKAGGALGKKGELGLEARCIVALRWTHFLPDGHHWTKVVNEMVGNSSSHLDVRNEDALKGVYMLPTLTTIHSTLLVLTNS